jgi:hypothetical protein
VYLVAIMDWYSRYVLSWEVSINMETSFCLTALGLGLEEGEAGNLQLGSRRAVHQPGVHESFVGSRDRHQHGREGARVGQRLCRTLVANGSSTKKFS